jgi:hypothetical protein
MNELSLVQFRKNKDGILQLIRIVESFKSIRVMRAISVLVHKIFLVVHIMRALGSKNAQVLPPRTFCTTGIQGPVLATAHQLAAFSRPSTGSWQSNRCASKNKGWYRYNTVFLDEVVVAVVIVVRKTPCAIRLIARMRL